MENWNFLSDCKDSLSSCVGEARLRLIKLHVFKKIKVHKCLCNKFVSVSVLWILFPRLNKGKNCKMSQGISMQMLKNSLWEFKFNLLWLLILYVDIGTRYIPNKTNCSAYHWNQNRNKAENKCYWLQQMYLFICLQYLYLIIKLCLFTCKRQDMSKNSNTNLLLQHFWINIWCLVLFTY